MAIQRFWLSGSAPDILSTNTGTAHEISTTLGIADQIRLTIGSWTQTYTLPEQIGYGFLTLPFTPTEQAAGVLLGIEFLGGDVISFTTILPVDISAAEHTLTLNYRNYFDEDFGDLTSMRWGSILGNTNGEFAFNNTVKPTLDIITNGTDGGVDGTVEVPNDRFGVDIGALNSVTKFHIRAYPDHENAEPFVVNAPPNCTVGSDGINFGATCSYAAESITGVNVPCWIKRTTASPFTETGLTTTPRLDTIDLQPASETYFTGTMGVTVSGQAVIFSGLSATTTSPRTLVRIEGRNKLSSSETWSSASTLMTFWSTPDDYELPHILYQLGTVGTYDVAIRIVDSTTATSSWVQTRVSTSATTLPVRDTFNTISAGSDISLQNGWWLNRQTANTFNATAKEGIYNGLAGAILKNNAPVSSPATAGDIEVRKLISVDPSISTYFDVTMTPCSIASVSFGFRLFMGASVISSIVYTASTGVLTCYNGSTFVTIKTGLSGNISLRVIPIYGTQTATVIVNGENLGTVTIWRVVNAQITSMLWLIQGGNLTNNYTAGISNIGIGVV